MSTSIQSSNPQRDFPYIHGESLADFCTRTALSERTYYTYRKIFLAAEGSLAPSEGEADTEVYEAETVEEKAIEEWAVYSLWTLVLLATAAELGNMYAVVGAVGGGWAGLILTGVFSCAGLLFTAIGAQSWFCQAIGAMGILFQALCNLVVFFGTMYWFTGTSAEGYRIGSVFVQQVAGLFGGTPYWCAVAFAVLGAAFIAAIQFGAIALLRKK